MIVNAVVGLKVLVGAGGWAMHMALRLPQGQDGTLILPIDDRTRDMAQMLGVAEVPCDPIPCRLELEETDTGLRAVALLDLLDDARRWDFPVEDVPQEDPTVEQAEEVEE